MLPRNGERSEVPDGTGSFRGIAIRTTETSGSRLLLHHRDGKAVLDGLGVWVGFFEFLAGAFHVATQVFDVRLQLLVHRVLFLVVVEVFVLDLAVELPGVGLRPLHADLKAVILDDAGELTGQTLLADKLYCSRG